MKFPGKTASSKIYNETYWNIGQIIINLKGKLPFRCDDKHKRATENRVLGTIQPCITTFTH